jgi:hypothetical protein
LTASARVYCPRTIRGGAVHVAVGGELDMGAVSHFDAALRLAWASAGSIVLDLRELEFHRLQRRSAVSDVARRIHRAGGHLTATRDSQNSTGSSPSTASIACSNS